MMIFFQLYANERTMTYKLALTDLDLVSIFTSASQTFRQLRYHLPFQNGCGTDSKLTYRKAKKWISVAPRLAFGVSPWHSEEVPWTMGRKCRFVRTPSPRKRRRRTWPRPREGEPRRRPGACWSEQSDARVAQQRVLTQQGPLRGNDHPLLFLQILFILFIIFFTLKLA